MKKSDAFTVEIISKLFVLNVFADEAGGDPPAVISLYSEGVPHRVRARGI